MYSDATAESLTLPPELLAAVIDSVDDSRTLATLGQTCQAVWSLVEKRLYQTVRFDNAGAARLAVAMDLRPEHRQAVREVIVSESEGSACTHAPLYATFNNLETLDLTSGYWHWDDNDEEGTKWETDQDVLDELFKNASITQPLDQRLWPNLRCVTLDFQEENGQGWFLIFEPAIFLLPSLLELTVRGCRFGEHDGADLEQSPYRRQMALQKLTLERSYIMDIALRRFLAMPRALTHLTLGHSHEYWHHEMGGDESTSLDWDAYGLEQQKDSLVVLEVNDGVCAGFRSSLDLRNFLALRMVRTERRFRDLLLVGPECEKVLKEIPPA